MGKRERRRRRQQLLAESLTPALPHRHDRRSTAVHVAGAAMVNDLAALATRLRDVERAVDDEIDRLVALGVGWPVIAAAGGVSRQAARQRWLRRQR
jgi:hypothetical protein